MEDEDVRERNRRFVIGHFDDFVNKRDVGAIDRNMAEDFVDHDGPGGASTGRAGDRAMMEAMYRTFPDLHVEVLQSLAEGEMVMVRNRWIGTDFETKKAMEFHGFVLWRIAHGKIVERWATVTPLHELAVRSLEW